MEVKKISIDLIKPNSWNPNKMDDDTFERLAEELETVGYIDPIQVVPMEDGTYQIIGGEHRWRVLKVLGYEEIDCVVLTDEQWRDEDLRKFVTVRLNALHGKIDPKKFIDLYNDLADKYEEDALQTLMGFTDDSAWKELTKDVRQGLKDAGAPSEVLSEFDKVSKDIKTVDDLSNILNRLFTDFGDTLRYNFMVFSFGKKKHLYVQCSRKTWKKVVGLIQAVKDAKVDMSEVFDILIGEWKNVVSLDNMKKVDDGS